MAIYLPFISNFQGTNTSANWSNILCLILLEILFLPMGVASCATPITSKIIFSSEGIEYRNLAAVVKARWLDVHIRKRDTTGKIVSVSVSNPEVLLRTWTRLAPWNAQKGVTNNTKHFGIPVSQFGCFTPNKLSDDIHHFMPSQSD